MIWVVQENLFNEKEYRRFLQIIEKSGIEYRTVKVIPFSHEMIPAIEYEGKKVAYGSTTLMKIVLKEGWDPGCYFNENFDARKWSPAYGKDMLNSDAVFCKFKDVPLDYEEIFIRPCEDLKLFTGEVTSRDKFKEWQERVLTMDSESTLTKETYVAVSMPKKINREYRFFVVDGEIVTGSLYKIGRTVTTSIAVEPAALKFAQRMVRKWSPHKVFVIDVAHTPEGYKVIEINCANGAGFYSCDVSKLVQAIYVLETR